MSAADRTRTTLFDDENDDSEDDDSSAVDEDADVWEDELEFAASLFLSFEPLTAQTIAPIKISAATPISTQNHHLLVTGFFGATGGRYPAVPTYAPGGCAPG